MSSEACLKFLPGSGGVWLISDTYQLINMSVDEPLTHTSTICVRQAFNVPYQTDTVQQIQCFGQTLCVLHHDRLIGILL